jgi:solute carrier family 25 protein 33/36
MCGAIVTSPFDVVKTRLQSDLFRQKHAAVGVMGSSSTVVLGAPRTTSLLYNFVETGGIIRYVSQQQELFRFMFHVLFSPFFIIKETYTAKNQYEVYSKA